ncbi:MAG TPA: AI-2E family transporter [Anaerolineales bacterium]
MAVNPLSQPSNWSFRRVVWATLVLVSVMFFFWLFYRFYQVVFLLFIAVVVGTVIRPLVNWLNQRGIPRIAGVILVYLLLLLLAGFLWLLFPLIFEQGSTLAREVPGYYQSLRAGMLKDSNQLLVRLGQLIPATLPGLNAGIAPQTGEEVVASAEQVLGYILLTAQVIFTAIVILVLTLYWAIDGPRIIKSCLLLVPQDQRDSIGELVSAMEGRIGFFIAGQGVLCLVIGIMALISYTLIGLPNALVLALVAGVMEAVPLIGPLLGAVPAALVALSIGPDRLIWVIIATVVIQQLENSLELLRIMKKAVGVNPFVTLLALFAFSTLFGLAGALMAIPIAAMIQLVLNHFVFQQATVEMEVSEGRDYASRLRYEAQDLIQDLRKQARHKKRGTDLKIQQIEQVMDEIETITANLDTLLAQAKKSDAE